VNGRERGAALVEALFLCLILLVPVVWGLAVLDQVHRAALASTAAVRDAGFEAIRAPDIATAGRAIDAAVTAALRDQGLDPDHAEVRWSAPGRLERGTRVEISVRFHVEVLGDWLPLASVPVMANHALWVEPFGSRDA
jgi:hypothetical protein